MSKYPLALVKYAEYKWELDWDASYYIKKYNYLFYENLFFGSGIEFVSSPGTWESFSQKDDNKYQWLGFYGVWWYPNQYSLYTRFVPAFERLYKLWQWPGYQILKIIITSENSYYINTTQHSTNYYYTLAQCTYYKIYSGSIYQKQTSAYSHIYSGSIYRTYSGRSYRYSNLYA